MFRVVLASSVVLLGSSQLGTSSEPEPASSRCCATVVAVDEETPRPRRDNSLTRAVRRSVSPKNSTPLTREDLLGLYVLVSLHGERRTGP